MINLVNRERLLQEFLKLVQIDSVSGQEGLIRDHLAERLRALGLEVYEDGAGQALGGESGNLIAWLEGKVKGPSLLFCAHMDTVQPGKGVRPVVEGDLIKTSGDTVLGGDDKAGIAGILEALQVLRENNLSHPPLEVIFTVSEEMGLMGSKHLDHTRLRSKNGFVLDAAGEVGTIIVQGPSQNEFEIEVCGRSAHAGINPEDGINAIALAAYAITGLQVGRLDEETTCNLGTINGGQARNIVPDLVTIKGEARSLNQAKLESLTAEITRVFKERVQEKGGSCQVKVKPLYPAFCLEDDDELVRLAADAARALGKEPLITKSGGGSDANILNKIGLKAINLGIGMRAVHTVEEYIYIQDLIDNVHYILKIIEQAGAKRLD